MPDAIAPHPHHDHADGHADGDGEDGDPPRRLVPAPTIDDVLRIDDALPARLGWRARLDDWTGGLASTVLRPAGLAAAVGVVVVALVVWWWTPGDPPDPLDLPVATTAPAAAPPPDPDLGPGQAADPASGGGPGSAGADVAGHHGPVTVHVVGAVAAPGVQVLPGGTRVVDALTAAGGPTGDADLEQLNLAQPVVDGSQVRVPRRGEVVPAPVTGPLAGVPPDAGAGGPTGPGGPPAPISLSRATPEELEALPGVGPATAAAIVAHRVAHGPFRTVEDLLAVRGIGDKRLEALRDLVVP